MLSTILVVYPWLTTAALAALVIFGPLIGARLVPHPRATLTLLGLSIAVMALLTLVPTNRVLEIGCAVEWNLPRLGAVEYMANVILFVPLALLAGILTRRPLVTFVAASGLSLLIEVLQAFATVLGRSCSTNDWLANTLGALLGAVLAAVALRLAGSARTRKPLQNPATHRQ